MAERRSPGPGTRDCAGGARGVGVGAADAVSAAEGVRAKEMGAGAVPRQGGRGRHRPGAGDHGGGEVGHGGSAPLRATRPSGPRHGRPRGRGEGVQLLRLVWRKGWRS